jgi:hypothetical protein
LSAVFIEAGLLVRAQDFFDIHPGTLNHSSELRLHLLTQDPDAAAGGSQNPPHLHSLFSDPITGSGSKSRVIRPASKPGLASTRCTKWRITTRVSQHETVQLKIFSPRIPRSKNDRADRNIRPAVRCLEPAGQLAYNQAHTGTANLKPAFFIIDVGVHKILIALGQIDDSFDEANNTGGTTGTHANDELDDAFLGVAKVEFVNCEAAQQNAENASHNLFVRTGDFFAHNYLEFSDALVL